jgi:hypothetical protein
MECESGVPCQFFSLTTVWDYGPVSAHPLQLGGLGDRLCMLIPGFYHKGVIEMSLNEKKS